MLETECQDLHEDKKSRVVKEEQCEVCCEFTDHKGQYGKKGDDVTLLVSANECRRRTGGSVKEPDGEKDASACDQFINDNQSDCGLVWDAKREVCRCPGELKKKDFEEPVENSEYHRKSDGDCVCCDEDEGWNDETEQCTNCLQQQIYIGIAAGDENVQPDSKTDNAYNDAIAKNDAHNTAHGVVFNYPVEDPRGGDITGLDIPMQGSARLPSRNTFANYVKGKLGGNLDGTFVNVVVGLDTSGSTKYEEWSAIGGEPGIAQAIQEALEEIFKDQCCKGDPKDCFSVSVTTDGSEDYEVMAMGKYEADFTADGKP